MIITENREKVKRKALSLIKQYKGDVNKPDKKFENIHYVHDGSSNSIKPGYLLNQITGY